jgi:hypothetical protein
MLFDSFSRYRDLDALQQLLNISLVKAISLLFQNQALVWLQLYVILYIEAESWVKLILGDQ